MEGKTILLFITLLLLTGFGILISKVDRADIVNNWTTRRCEIPIMFASYFFKPESDSRTNSEFAGANFEFCMKTYVDTFMASMMVPVNAIIGKQLNVASSSVDMMNTIRTIASNLFKTFSVYLEQYYRRFNATVFEISKAVQFLRMAMKRISGIMMTMVYSGITLFNAILNTIQFIIKVILIVCGIMILLMIILFFILFPVIPIILYTLSIIIKTVLSLSGIIDPGVADEAQSKKGGFCFAEWSEMIIIKDGQPVKTPIHSVKVGDEIPGGHITAVIHMDGENVDLYRIGSIYVSGTHLIKGTNGVWKLVSEDNRAVKTLAQSKTVYCFNTTTNIIEMNGLQFRDWEEIANNDENGQIIWNYNISSILNEGKSYQLWKDNLKNYVNMALVSKEVGIKCKHGFIPIKDISIGDYIVDHEGLPHKVLGVIWGEVEADKEQLEQGWVTELYELVDNIWVKGKSTVYPGVDITEGMSLITENGECIIWDSVMKKEKRIRDFTEIGYNCIYKTYSYIDARLRIKE